VSNIYKINNEKFKGICISYNFTFPIVKEQVAQNAVLSSILAKESKKYSSQQDIELYLASLYGASFDTNVEKIGDLYNLEFRVEIVNRKFLPENADVLEDVLKFLYEVIYNPKIEKNEFGKEIVEREKAFILEKINERKDEKLKYAVYKTEELVCKNDPFGVYVYGREDDIQNINPKFIYDRYIDIINNSCITVIASGNLSGYSDIEERIKKIFNSKLESNLNYGRLKTKTRSYINRNDDVEEIKESAETSQSVLTMGFKVDNIDYSDMYALNVYNTILGGIPSSKLFQNVREKESLAYTVRSRYYRYKGFILIYAGIDAKNYTKAREIILKQLTLVKDGIISEEEFEAAKQSLVSDLLEWEDSKIAPVKFLLGNLVIYEDYNLTVEDMINGIKKIKLNDVTNVAKKIKLQTIYFLGGETNA
jgi:predicted Zn-dependent peptidase